MPSSRRESSSSLEQGTVPWRKPWKSIAPQNLISGHAYRGINPFILSCTGHSSPFWLTFKQAKQLGGHVRKGERAAPVVFWKVFTKEVEGEDGEKETVSLPVLRRWSVFNVEQCEGIPSKRIPDLTPMPFKPIEKAERIVKGMPQAPAIKHGATGAWYEPRADLVRMPDPGHFDPAESYYSTLFHELTHNAEARIMPREAGAAVVSRFGPHTGCGIRSDWTIFLGSAF